MTFFIIRLQIKYTRVLEVVFYFFLFYILFFINTSHVFIFMWIFFFLNKYVTRILKCTPDTFTYVDTFVCEYVHEYELKINSGNCAEIKLKL